MNSILYLIIGVLVGGLPGVLVGRFLLRKLFKDQEVAAQNKVKKILKDAENDAEILKKNRLLEAKEKFLQMKTEHEQQVNERNNTVNQRENSVKQKEQSLNSRLENMNRKETELDNTRKTWSGKLKLLLKNRKKL